MCVSKHKQVGQTTSSTQSLMSLIPACGKWKRETGRSRMLCHLFSLWVELETKQRARLLLQKLLLEKSVVGSLHKNRSTKCYQTTGRTRLNMLGTTVTHGADFVIGRQRGWIWKKPPVSETGWRSGLSLVCQVRQVNKGHGQMAGPGLISWTYSFIMWGCRKSFRFWISLRIFPTTSRLRIFCRLSIFTATLCPVSSCLPTAEGIILIH